MVARVTLAEIDTVRMSVERRGRACSSESVLPALREQDGLRGLLRAATREGKALVLTFWETRRRPRPASASGFYAEQVEKFVTLFRSPPGRETYDVVLADAPGGRDRARSAT